MDSNFNLEEYNPVYSGQDNELLFFENIPCVRMHCEIEKRNSTHKDKRLIVVPLWMYPKIQNASEKGGPLAIHFVHLSPDLQFSINKFQQIPKKFDLCPLRTRGQSQAVIPSKQLAFTSDCKEKLTTLMQQNYRHSSVPPTINLPQLRQSSIIRTNPIGSPEFNFSPLALCGLYGFDKDSSQDITPDPLAIEEPEQSTSTAAGISSSQRFNDTSTSGSGSASSAFRQQNMTDRVQGTIPISNSEETFQEDLVRLFESDTYENMYVNQAQTTAVIPPLSNDVPSSSEVHTSCPALAALSKCSSHSGQLAKPNDSETPVAKKKTKYGKYLIHSIEVTTCK